MYFQRYFLLFLSLMLSTVTYAQAAPIKLGAPFFPPYAYFDIDGQLSGIWIKQLNPTLSKANIDFKAVHLPIARFYSSVATGKVQFSALPKGLPGMEKVLFSQQPFAYFDLRVFWLNQAPEITQVGQLADKRVALIKGYSYGGVLQQDLPETSRGQFVVAENQLQAIKMLLNNEVDYVVGYWAIMDFLQKNFPDTQLSNQKVAELPVYFAVHQSTPDAKGIIARFEQALRQ